MIPSISSLPGYQEYEYLLIINPPTDLQNRILKIRQELADKYKLPPTKSTKAYIPLLKFITPGMMEERIVQRLQLIAMGAAPFKVELKDYGSFPSHTLYINVSTRLPIQKLVKELRQVQPLLKASPHHTPYFMEQPFVAIAQKLKPWQYQKSWLEYSHRHFTARFIADSMLLLKRIDNTKAWQIVKRFEFMNLPVTTKQGELFM